jgi:TM2 domain-containing membrane protein YozV
MTIDRGTMWIGGACAAAAAAVIFFYDPAVAAFFPSCPLRALTGLLCPLCGGLRAAHALLHGRVVEGVAMVLFLLNIVGVLLCLVGCIVTAPLSVAALMYAYEDVFAARHAIVPHSL